MRRILFFSLIVSVGLSTGCGRPSLNSQQNLFLMEISPNPQRLSAPVEGVLKIRYCRAAAPFDNPYFLYRTQSGQYQQDYYKLFLTPPNEQIDEHLRTWLDQSGIFRGVLPASSAAKSDYVLEPHLSALYCDLSEPTQPQTVLKFHAVLLKTDKDYQASRIVLEKTYQYISPMQNNTSQDVITNYNICLEKFLVQLQSDIILTLKKGINNE
jgi:ABC-type uncharacterized transport system auxiliary subunit